MTRWRLGLIAALALVLAACTTPLWQHERADFVLSPFTGKPPPAAPREFRAAWVATVANIDWPSRSGLDAAQQQAEITTLLDAASALKLNAIILQVRPSADAIYPSELEPWTEYLSGQQGQPPQPAYDPLALWISQAHARGIELHAWINPYRARHFSARSPVAPSHISRTHPDIVKPYGDMLWMDPAEPLARARTLDVVSDIVRRYDVDGIHIDDYFYPYPVESAGDFPDEPSWLRYQASGGALSRADWRRDQVNQLIEAMYQRVHADKPWVRFGISPFGLGKPERRAPGISGFSQYDSIYADAEHWLEQGWLDYLAPQLYWPAEQAGQPFATLLQTWVRDNTQSRHIWPGMFTSRIDDTAKSWAPQEIARQIDLVRANTGASGHIHFSLSALAQDRKGVATQLRAGRYASAALAPATPWLRPADARAPESVQLSGAGPHLVRIAGGGPLLQNFAVWRRYGKTWRFTVQPAAQTLLDVSADDALGPVTALVVQAIDRFGIDGPAQSLDLQPAPK